MYTGCTATGAGEVESQIFINKLHLLSADGCMMEKNGEVGFTMKHFQGTSPVMYSAAGWRHISYNMSRTNLASELLRKSEK